jgi:16S rRNA (adenine1518-N6/adenine1519-N6)-dimethyltransferase
MPIPKKSLGQNFLMHAQIAERIAKAAELPENAYVLEIGPGTGMLTKPLLAIGASVIAVEADGSLMEELSEKFATEIGSGKLSLINEDIRTFDPNQLPEEYHIVANIPYYITGEIIRRFLSASHKPRSMTLLVQREVAVRIARTKKESLLSLSVKIFGTPSYCFTVPRGAFFPAPNVDSAVITIQNISDIAFSGGFTEEVFFSIIKTGFAHKRKQLAKNLEDLFTSESIKAALVSAELRPDIRPEDLSLEDWKKIAHEVKSNEK